MRILIYGAGERGKYYVWIQKMNKNDEKHPESYNPYS